MMTTMLRTAMGPAFTPSEKLHVTIERALGNWHDRHSIPLIRAVYQSGFSRQTEATGGVSL